MPHIDISSEDFTSLPKFSQFVTRVLSCRNNEIEVSSVKLGFRGKASQAFVKKIMNYAFSHDVQNMTIICLLEKNIEFPLSLFSCQSLKDLTLTGSNNGHSVTTTSSWELPALTTLHLNNVSFYGDNTVDKGIGLFSKCINLKNLTLNEFGILNSDTFSICHPRLSNLTLERGYRALSFLNVVAPQLENLRIYNSYGQHLIFAPQLVSLDYKYCEPLQFSTDDDLCSLEKVDLYIYPYRSDICKVIGLLQRLHNVKYLKLNLELVQVYLC